MSTVLNKQFYDWSYGERVMALNEWIAACELGMKEWKQEVAKKIDGGGRNSKFWIAKLESQLIQYTADIAMLRRELAETEELIASSASPALEDGAL